MRVVQVAIVEAESGGELLGRLVHSLLLSRVQPALLALISHTACTPATDVVPSQ